MAKFREGQGAINNVYNSTPYDNVLVSLSQKIKTSNSNVVRVKSIILDSTHPRYEELGGENSIGTIIFDDNIEIPNVSNDISVFPYARPLNSNIKHYPLINELVYIFRFPSNEIGKNTALKQTYYIDVVSLWNHPHHNAYPDTPNALPPSQDKDYTETQAGSVRRVTDQSTEINLGNTFKERDNIHPLSPFEGDLITEGRWGNSIRLGSTVNGSNNNWSLTGSNGDPIVILRNGQGEQNNDGWVHITEDINNDESSIYLTSTQQIPLAASSTKYNSYIKPPDAPNKYSGKQIILNSGRLILNSTNDHILITSNKTINLNAVSSVNIDTPTIILQSKSVLLGSKDATESVLKGDTTIDLLTGLVDQLTLLSTALQTVITPAGPAVNPAATQLITYLSKLKVDLNTLTKSTVSKTI
jgi:hypothetical protein